MLKEPTPAADETRSLGHCLGMDCRLLMLLGHCGLAGCDTDQQEFMRKATPLNGRRRSPRSSANASTLPGPLLPEEFCYDKDAGARLEAWFVLRHFVVTLQKPPTSKSGVSRLITLTCPLNHSRSHVYLKV
jgi:hypothetical protein